MSEDAKKQDAKCCGAGKPFLSGLLAKCKAAGVKLGVAWFGGPNAVLGTQSPVPSAQSIATIPNCACLDCQLERSWRRRKAIDLPFAALLPREIERLRESLNALEAWLRTRAAGKGITAAEGTAVRECWKRLNALDDLAFALYLRDHAGAVGSGKN